MASSERWHFFLSQGLCTQQLVGNVHCDTHCLNVDGMSLPVTFNLTGRADTSWVASLRNSYGPYARAETELVPMGKMEQSFFKGASVLAEELLSLAGLRGGLFLNNWLLATNLYDRSFNLKIILAVRDDLVRRFPDQPVIIRSLTPPLHADLLAGLVAEGFYLIPTRQVWLMTELRNGEWRRHSDVRKDFALEKHEKTKSEWVSGVTFSGEDYSRALWLYNQLYREKYPRFNPAYSEAFLQRAITSGWLTAYGLRINGQLEGFVGLIEQDGWFATPLLGYNLAAERRRGIYRRLMLKAFSLVEDAGGHLHCSGGAGNFKQQRGAHFAVEFAAVSAAHLRGYRRPALVLLNSLLNKLAVPYLQKRAL